MTAPINPNLARVFAPPVMEARRWLAETEFPADRPLLNLSQAAPVDPPPDALCKALAEALGRAETHLYGPVLGDPALRERIAADWSALYGGAIGPGQVGVTAGCNQAFCTAVSTVCAPGDAVMVPVPWYFNHRMWLDMAGIDTVPLACGPHMVPDPAAAAAALTPATRAILLISPNNPTGVTYPPEVMEGFFDLCHSHGLALIVDETYRDFCPDPGPPHGLFARADWPEVLIHLYSFSKVFRLTGYRTGALICDTGRLVEAEKMLDTVTICPPRLGQIGALYGLEHLAQWVAGERAEILARRAALVQRFAEGLPGWRVRGSGAYFAWVEPPFDIASDVLARRLVAEQSVLVLPGTMFTPAGDPAGQRALRIAFANADAEGLAELMRRLAAFAP